MAGVDKFGAAFAIGFMALMLAIMVGISPDGSTPAVSTPSASMPTQTYTPPAQTSPPETASTPSTSDTLTGFLKYTIRAVSYTHLPLPTIYSE